ncbi:beta strand repeat-containing protein [Burkholderia cenocepacia]|uniref:beta strand repeat-containing protein n=1 Tax=Burkholderia cenocepacia TaxID=95486 RepID=UPI00201192E5|nr:hypothetical protein [Burkholderia cenocepacia]
MNANGTIKAPTFNVQGKLQNTVADAVGALDTATTKNTNDIGGLSSKVDKLNATSHYVSIGGKQDGSDDAKTVGARDMAIGSSAVADSSKAGLSGQAGSDYSVAIGQSAQALGGGSVALGGGAQVGSAATLNQAIKGTALGAASKVTQTNAVALGQGSIADRANTVSVGSYNQGRQITNVDRGTDDRDAVTVTQLKGATSVIGGGAGVNADGTIKAPTFNVQGTTKSTVADAMGVLDAATTRNTNDIGGLSNKVDKINTTSHFISINGKQDGSADAKAVGSRDIAIGSSAVADSSKAPGSSAADYSIAIGQSAQASGGGTVAIGGGAQVGSDATLNQGFKGTALGAASKVTQANAVALGNGSIADRANTVSVGSYGQGRQITNVDAGTDVRDAVNVRQLQGVASAIGGVGVNADGTIKAPSFSVQGTTQTSVAGAVNQLDQSLTQTSGTVADMKGDVASLKNGTAGLVQQDPATKAITVGKDKAGTSVSLAGTAGERVLTGVKDGALSAGSHDAVTGSQLFATNQGVAKNTQSIDGLTDKVNTINTNIGDVSNMVKYDDASHGQLTLGGLKDDGKGGKIAATAPVKLSNVAAGTAKSDATNVEQLSGAVVALGGGAKLDPTTGKVTGPSFNVQGGTQSTVAEAMGALDNATTKNAGDIAKNTSEITKNAGDITNLSNGTAGLVQQDPTTNAITVGKDKAGTSVSLAGTDGDRLLSGLKNALGNSDAVNLGQLKSAGFDTDATGKVLNRAVTYETGSIESGNPHVVLSEGTGNSKYFKNPDDRSSGYLPKGTVISNVANGLLQTDAVNVGQVTDMLNETIANGGINLRSAPIPRAMQKGSGVDATGLDTTYKNALYYSQIKGLGDAVGQTVPSDSARAAGAGSMALGSNAYASGDKSVATGVQAYASAADSVALGAGSVADQANTVSVGSSGTGSYVAHDTNGAAYTIQNKANARRVVNMAAGQSDTDAVNVSQLKGVTDAIGDGAGVNADGTIKAPMFNVQGGTQATVAAAIGVLDTATTKNSGDIAKNTDGIAKNTTDIAKNATDVTGMKGDIAGLTNGTAGLVQQDPTTQAITIGKDQAGTSVSLAGTVGERVLTGVKDGALSAGSHDAVTGSQLFATNQDVAKNTSAIAQNTQDIGGLSGKVDAINANIGDVGNMVKYDDASHGQLTLGGLKDDGQGHQIAATAPVKLSNVAAGTAKSDATNVEQLSGAVDALGGGAKLDPTTGKVTGPTFGVQGGTQTTVAAAIGVLDTATTKNSGDIAKNTDGIAKNTTDIAKNATDVTGMKGDIAGLTNGTAGLVQQDPTTQAITIGKDQAGTSVSLAGTVGERVLTGVKDGALSAGSHDAVTGSQLFATNQDVAKNTSAIAQNTQDIGGLSGKVDAINANIGDVGNMVKYDDASHGQLTLGGLKDDGQGHQIAATAPVKLSNVAAGTAKSDATNVEQLSGAVDALGGGAKLDPTTGKVTGPTFGVQGGTQTTVAAAIGVLDTATTKNSGDIAKNTDGIAKNTTDIAKNATDVTGMKGDIAGLTNGTAGLVQQDPTTQAITIGKDQAGTSVSLAGTVGERVLTGVKDGALSAGSHDAVTGYSCSRRIRMSRRIRVPLRRTRRTSVVCRARSMRSTRTSAMSATW